jgi:4-aminobutyrate aminotransferase-like enzyme
MWGHEHWYLQDATDGGCPDIVTFGGRAGISGFYSTLQYKLHPHCTSFAQDVDMVKLMNYHATWSFINRKRLLEKVVDTSTFLKIELGNIARDKGYI